MNNFQYYLDSKSINIPFEYIDTIARIYSVKYNCRNIYYDNYNNILVFEDDFILSPEIRNKKLLTI